LTSPLDGSEWSDSCTGHFIPRETDPGTDWIGGWMGSRAGLDAVVKSAPAGNRTPDRIKQLHYSCKNTKLGGWKIKDANLETTVATLVVLDKPLSKDELVLSF